MSKVIMLILTLLVVFCFAADKDIDSEMLNIKLGTKVEELKKKYPNMYRHQLLMGEVLHEACDQEKLIVTTISEAAWARGFITDISIRKEKDKTVCRDSMGELPDIPFKPETIRGLKFGDSEKIVIKYYGKPTERCVFEGEKVILRYRRAKIGRNPNLNRLRFAVTLERGSVVGLSLSSDLADKKSPYDSVEQKLDPKCEH